MIVTSCIQRTRLGDVAVFENRQPVTAAKFINKNSLFILLLGVIRLPKPKLISDTSLIALESPRHIANAMLATVTRHLILIIGI